MKKLWQNRKTGDSLWLVRGDQSFFRITGDMVDKKLYVTTYSKAGFIINECALSLLPPAQAAHCSSALCDVLFDDDSFWPELKGQI